MNYTCVFLLVFVCHGLCHHMPFFLTRKSCLAHECRRNSDTRERTINNLIRPCVNFYEYACHQWKSNHKKPDSEPFWNQYSDTSSRIYSRLAHLLETNHNIGNARELYEICLKAENKDYTDELGFIIRKLGGWSSEETKIEGYNYLEHIVEVTKLLNVNPILKFHVDIDFKNHSKSALYIEPGSFVFPEILLTDPETHTEPLAVYEQWVEKTLEAAFRNVTVDFKESSKMVVAFETELALLAGKKGQKIRITVRDLSIVLGTNFGKILHFLFENTEIDFESVTYVITYPEYLHMLGKIIKKTNANVVSNYIVWSALKDVARSVSQKLRHINFEVDRAILGVSEDLPRVQECIQNVLDFFSLELAGPYIGSYFDLKTVASVRDMARSIKKEFIETLEFNTWMSSKAKYMAIKRVASLRFEIGVSDSVLDASFTKLDLLPSFFVSMLKLKNLKSTKHLNSFHSSKIRWPCNIFEVNAFYNILQNTIVLPLGILHPPFFDLSGDPVSNYGALGSLIGHELSHSLDSMASSKHSWSENDINHYNVYRSCFKRQYDYYGVDGSHTINENIADNMGIQASYRALQKSTGELSGIQRRTFFIDFGKMWCEVSSEDDLLLEEHAPVQFRVFGALQNFGDFKHTFGCLNLKSFNCKLW